MRKNILSILLTFCLIIPCFFVLTACSNNEKSSRLNLENSTIKNFANYSSIGAAYVNETIVNNSSTVRLNPGNNKQGKKIKIIGKEKDGGFEEIEYEKEEKSIEQTWQVKDMISLGKLVFINYTNKELSSFNSWDNKKNPGSRAFQIINDEYNASYIVDSETGKVYSTVKLANKINYLEMNPAYGYLGYTADAVYVLKTSYYVNNMINFYEVFKICIENEELAVIKLIDNKHLDFNNRNMLVDCYGNVFLNANNIYGVYILKNNGGLKIIEDLNLIQSINGVVYCGEKKFNKDCELIDKGQNEEILSSSYELINDNNDIKYYLLGKSLVKTTWDDDGNFSVEKFNLERDYSNFACTLNKIYFIEAQSIFYYDLKNNLYQNLVSDYIFSSIKAGYDNEVLFTGLDFSLQIINGVIKDDGTIDINISDNGYEIIYIKPLN